MDAVCVSVRPSWNEIMAMEMSKALGVIQRLPGLDDQTKALLALFGGRK